MCQVSQRVFQRSFVNVDELIEAKALSKTEYSIDSHSNDGVTLVYKHLIYTKASATTTP